MSDPVDGSEWRGTQRMQVTSEESTTHTQQEMTACKHGAELHHGRDGDVLPVLNLLYGPFS